MYHRPMTNKVYPDFQMAVTGYDDETHLTSDADLTLCGLSIADLPTHATRYCIPCIDAENKILRKIDKANV